MTPPRVQIASTFLRAVIFLTRSIILRSKIVVRGAQGYELEKKPTLLGLFLFNEFSAKTRWRGPKNRKLTPFHFLRTLLGAIKSAIRFRHH